jgi:hypothetical protein
MEITSGFYDGNSIKFCRDFPNNVQHPARNIFKISPADTEMVVKFFSSIIYRYSLSTLPEAAHVDLGPFEDMFRDILFNGASCASEPATILFRYRSSVIAPEQICLPPFTSPFLAGLDGYSVAPGGFRALVKVDSRPLPAELEQMIINGKTEITGGFLEFETTHEFAAMRSLVQDMPKRPKPPMKPGTTP